MSRRTLAVALFTLLPALALGVGVGVARFGGPRPAGSPIVMRAISHTSVTPARPDCFHLLGGTPVASYGEARKAAAFPVLEPTTVPPGFTLVLIKAYGLAPRDESKRVSAAYIESDYCDAAGHFLALTQGYTGFIATFSYRNAPGGSKGVVQVDGHQAYWVRGTAAPGSTPGPGAGEQAWQPDAPFTSLGWQSGTDDVGSRFVSLASDTLDVDQLVAVAASLR
jgi:hypothetical protein